MSQVRNAQNNLDAARLALRQRQADHPDDEPTIRDLERQVADAERALDDATSRACKQCGGEGRRTYSSTATWRGGIGGQALTDDVCDVCWGSGDSEHPGENLRKARGS